MLDDTPHYFEVKNGEVTTLRIKNEANSGILIHKVDTSGEGIYGVKFLLYDEDRNPIGEFTSDDNGYVYITSDDLPDGANSEAHCHCADQRQPSQWLSGGQPGRCRRPVHEPVGNRTGCVDHSARQTE